MTDGGEGTQNIIISKETRQKMSIKGKLKIKEKNSMFGKKHSEETKKKMSENRKGKGGLAGEDHPMSGRKWWTDGKQNISSKECPGEGWFAGRVMKQI